MRLRVRLVFMLLIPLFCHAQYAWHALSTAPTSYRFDDFHFINPDTGWAINPIYNYTTTKQPGRVFRTYDGGNTWTKLVDSSETFYRSIGFADGMTGWIGNLADTESFSSSGVPATTDTVPFYETHDGGSTPGRPLIYLAPTLPAFAAYRW